MASFHDLCIKVSDTKICPYCKSNSLVKNGFTTNRKQQFLCKSCKRRCIDYYTNLAHNKNINQNIVLLTKEGMGIRSIARCLRISTTTVLNRIISIASLIKTPPINMGKTYEIDEMRSFLKCKQKIIWIVYALDRNTKNVVSFNVGNRSKKTLNHVIKTVELSNPKLIYTDRLIHYRFLIKKSIHKVTRYGTNRIERNNLSIRTHLKRLNRKTICYSKSLVILKAILKIYFWA
jgi:insertion element IS1 protein InsB